MSHCLVVKQGEDIFIGSDTAMSTKIGDKNYRLKGEMSKLFKFNDILLFCSGDMKTVSSIVDRLEKHALVTLNTTQKVAQEESQNISNKIDIIIIQNSQVFSISPYNNFEIKRLEEGDGINIWTAGVETNRSIGLVEQEISSGNNNIKSIYENVFESISDERVGATLQLYHINKDNARMIANKKIQESDIKYVNIVEDSRVLLVVAETLIGKVILAKDKLIVGDEEGTFEITGNLLTVKDRNKVVRLRLGEYADNTFGLQLMNKNGSQVVLDENGILQTWEKSAADNINQVHGLTMNVFIPNDTLSIRQARLRFRILAFRSYSGTTESGGGSVPTSAGGGAISKSTASGGSSSPTSAAGGASTRTSTSGGGVSKSTLGGGSYVDSTADGGGYIDTTADGSSGIVSDVTDINSSSGTHVHQFTIQPMQMIHRHGINIPTHTHGISIPSHTHEFSTPNHTHDVAIPNHTHVVNIPAHTHNFEIPNHTHTVTIQPHTHGIVPDIYIGTRATGIGVVINGIDRSNALGGKFTSSQSNLDISSYLNVGQWNEITLTAERMGRLESDLFMQCFMSTS